MNILFIVAHPDDEAFGPAGTIAKLSASGHKIWVASMCKGNRPGAEAVEQPRQISFNDNCRILGATPVLLNSSDLYLEYHTAVGEICKLINEIQPEIVYTHSTADIHPDHRLTAESTMVACRPKPDSCVKKLYMYEIPAATEWAFNKLGKPFEPNVFVDITEFKDIKDQCLKGYTSETYAYPDARSIEHIFDLAKVRGAQCGVMYAEAFELVYERS